jgi:hypothetical protein
MAETNAEGYQTSAVIRLSEYRKPLGDRLAVPGLKGGDGGGTFDGMPPDLPERVAVLETHIDHIRDDVSTLKGDVRDIRKDMKTDFLLTWAGMLVGAVALLGAMAKGFHWL